MKKKAFLLIAIILLLFTRLYRLNWGFPYLFHPDENNINSAVNQLSCTNFLDKECFNPHFYAYGQLIIYLSLILNHFFSFLTHIQSNPLTIAFSLRFISALSSIAGGYFFYKLCQRYYCKDNFPVLGFFLYILTPGLIQQAHFGTTESLLTTCILALLYFEQKYTEQGLIIGIATAAKPTALLFLVFPFLNALLTLKKTASLRKQLKLFSRNVLAVFLIAIITTVFLSPHYLIHFFDFWSAFNYETAIGLGKIRIFYTEQFVNTFPLVFQYQKIFPYALGWPITLLGTLGFFLKLKKNLGLRLFCLFFFLTQAFLFVKWTRFMAPLFPLFIFFTLEFLHSLKRFKKISVYALFFYQVFFGFGFLRIYFQDDTRQKASLYINQTINKGKIILSESANVVDVPTNFDEYPKYTALFLYNLDTDANFNRITQSLLNKADYVIIPSRRVLFNYNNARFPKIEKYYKTIFNSKKFKLIKTISANLNDDYSEETWTVFDHPTLWIYKKTRSY